MRTDIETDKRFVFCPNSSFIGFSTNKAFFGDIVQFQMPDSNIHLGRVIGRLKYAPPICDDKEPIRNWIIVAALSPTLDCTFERWIDPAWVIRTIPSERFSEMADVLNNFLAPELNRYSVDVLRRWVTSGWRTLSKYLASVAPQKTEVDHAS